MHYSTEIFSDYYRLIMIKRIEVVQQIKEVGILSENLKTAIADRIRSVVPIHDEDLFDSRIRSFISKLRQKYQKHKRSISRLLEYESVWLDGVLYESEDVNENIAGPGRPANTWDESSDRTKRRKVQSLKTNNNTLALASAAISRAKESPGKPDLSRVFKESMKNPQKVRTSLDAADKIPIMMSPDDALALKIQCDLSDNQYQLLRNASLKHNAILFCL